ncbi:5-oxoprolinase subunit PxpB [Cognatilysobacter tabacisoli]|uniref:5-oxoprolinase subunit PxpB n=1 Tax=Cognatilysobacter tabacisoli TaxID=2315424 RepID=UPI000E6B14F5|nr:5-oxoprolinase subunit PxpB [Lysobacter tabacisoli]
MGNAVPASPPRIEALADDAWLVTLGTSIDAATNAAVHALAARLRGNAPPWLRDVVPAYASLAVFVDPLQIDPPAARDWVATHVAAGAVAAPGTGGARSAIEIPVLYGGDAGPDLAAAARELGLDADELVARHAAPIYTVAMIGFAPGFPYLSGLDPALALPRLATPRTRVPAGSVAIGGAQTGIYPRESPGGWRLIGRTPCVLFDPQRAAPSLLFPGDRVRFRPVDATTFDALTVRTDGAK